MKARIPVAERNLMGPTYREIAVRRGDVSASSEGLLAKINGKLAENDRLNLHDLPEPITPVGRH